ncbi:MAG: hypothetical protein ACOYKD_09110 [Anaerolineaceae bacterium]|jgi:hypothetical protein
MLKLGIKDGFEVLWHGLKDWWADWPNQLLVSLAALLLSLTVVLYPAALFGVYHQAASLTHDQRTGLAGFWAGFKKHFKISLLWGLLNTLALALLLFALWFYRNSTFTGAAFFVWFTLIALAVWLVWQYIALSCFFLQEPQTLKLAWSNARALWINNPGFWLVIGVFLIGLLILSFRYYLPLLAGAEALLCIMGLRAVQRTLKTPAGA